MKAYAAELKGEEQQAAVKVLRGKMREGKVTLVYAAKDEERNNAAALKGWLEGSRLHPLLTRLGETGEGAAEGGGGGKPHTLRPDQRELTRHIQGFPLHHATRESPSPAFCEIG